MKPGLQWDPPPHHLQYDTLWHHPNWDLHCQGNPNIKATSKSIAIWFPILLLILTDTSLMGYGSCININNRYLPCCITPWSYPARFQLHCPLANQYVESGTCLLWAWHTSTCLPCCLPLLCVLTGLYESCHQVMLSCDFISWCWRRKIIHSLSRSVINNTDWQHIDLFSLLYQLVLNDMPFPDQMSWVHSNRNWATEAGKGVVKLQATGKPKTILSIRL